MAAGELAPIPSSYLNLTHLNTSPDMFSTGESPHNNLQGNLKVKSSTLVKKIIVEKAKYGALRRYGYTNMKPSFSRSVISSNALSLPLPRDFSYPISPLAFSRAFIIDSTVLKNVLSIGVD
jgi:hypothetical protein